MILTLIHIVDIIKQKIIEWHAIARLHNLSDRELRDIGITRYDIEYQVKHGNEK
jgi:uncharacterized protein YjiS (DUF1127 family)